MSSLIIREELKTKLLFWDNCQVNLNKMTFITLGGESSIGFWEKILKYNYLNNFEYLFFSSPGARPLMWFIHSL